MIKMQWSFREERDHYTDEEIRKDVNKAQASKMYLQISADRDRKNILVWNIFSNEHSGRRV